MSIELWSAVAHTLKRECGELSGCKNYETIELAEKLNTGLLEVCVTVKQKRVNN